MADYYPLLSRLVASLPESTAQSRQAIYERARAALVAQLSNANPPAPEASVQAEIAALDEAAGRLESEKTAQPPITAATTPDAPRAPIIAPPPARPRPPVVPDTQSTANPNNAVPANPETPAPAAPTISPPAMPPMPDGQAATQNQATGDWAPSHQEQIAPAGPPPVPPRPPASRTSGGQPAAYPPIQPPPANHRALHDLQQPAHAPASPTDDPAAMHPPVPPKKSRRMSYLWVVLPLFLVAAAVIGYFSFADRLPSVAFLSGTLKAIDPTKARPTNANPPRSGEKIGGRVAEAEPPAKPPSETTAPAVKKEQPPEQVAQRPNPSPPPVAENNNVSVTVAQRAALLVQTPTEENKQAIKSYVGTVVWSARNVNRDAGRPLSHSILAKINIPDAKFRAEMTIEKNTDSTLPASHTVTWRFFREKESLLPEILEVGALQMRDENNPNAESLAGAQAKITSDIYIIALDAADGAARSNMTAIKQKRWFDLPLKVTGGLLAKITLEKGRPGERILAEALKAWAAK